MPVTLQTSGPGFAKIKKDIERLKKSDVLVGVPASDSPRKVSLQSKIDALLSRPINPKVKNQKAALKRRQKNVAKLQAKLSANELITNAQLMWIHSKGSPLRGIPARPTLEPAIQENQALISPRLAKASQAIMDNKPAEAEKYLMRAGTIAVNAAKRRFGSSALAPNAPSTIARKRSDKPLIDTGILRRSIVSVVRVTGKQPIQSPETE
jgi:hypothetical protein